MGYEEAVQYVGLRESLESIAIAEKEQGSNSADLLFLSFRKFNLLPHTALTFIFRSLLYSIYFFRIARNLLNTI